jgi:hypothetical protein
MTCIISEVIVTTASVSRSGTRSSEQRVKKESRWRLEIEIKIKIKIGVKMEIHELFQRFDGVLSLGSNCFIKKYLQGVAQVGCQETQLFDYIGTSAWAIQVLLENRFLNFFHFPSYEYMHVLSKGDEYMMVHRGYYLRFKHDFLQSYKRETYRLGEKDYTSFKAKYQRRIPRFYHTMQTRERILFLRLEERNPDRVQHTRYTERFAISEVDQMLELCRTFQRIFPKNRITTIFLSSEVEESQWFEEEGLFVLAMVEPILQYDNCEIKIHQVLIEHMDFLKEKIVR